MAVARAVREEAQRLRRTGMAIPEIAEQLGVAKSSVSAWVRNIELTPQQIERLQERKKSYGAQNKGSRHNRQKYLSLRQSYQETGRAKAREQRPLHLAGCMLYWAEGAKHPNRFYFVNSDPNMLNLCMRFLREEMGIPDGDLIITVLCHFNDPVEMRRVEAYWLTEFGLQPENLRKTQFKKGSEKSRHVLLNGVCGIGVKRSVWLVQHVFGAIQEYGGFDNPEWLF
ncbi:MAG: hypothetical protein IAE80_04280 [Anaerolinea sp.]|nr:hypothetical protein [Anaerolinea sp.]